MLACLWCHTGIVRELEGLSVASERWPAKLATLKAAAERYQGQGQGQGAQEHGLGGAPPGTGASALSRRTLRTPDVSKVGATGRGQQG